MSNEYRVYGNIEIRLYQDQSDTAVVELLVSDPETQAEMGPVRGPASLSLDALTQQLLQSEFDPQKYGMELADYLFHDKDVRQFYQIHKATFESRDQMLRLRLSIDPGLSNLHGLRWELLCDPDTKLPLATTERILFSRFMLSQDRRRVKLKPKAELKALIAVSAPSDLATYRLAEVDKAGEIARARSGLAGIESNVVGQEDPLTLNRLIDAVRTGVDVLYLVCHGAQAKAMEPFLYLQNEEGKTCMVMANEFAQRIGELAEVPRLIVLASCESAGKEGDDITATGKTAAQAALAPRLAEAGVPAVIAMQGKISMKTVEQAMPKFFTELLKDGQIDRALAVARGDVRERHDSWMPALFTRLKSGRLWHDPGFVGDSKDTARHSASPAKPLPLPSRAEVQRYLQELMDQTAKLPDYYPQHLQQTIGTKFDQIRQTVQVVKDRERFQQWAEGERQRMMEQFDNAHRYDPNKARPEREDYDNKRLDLEQLQETPMDWEKAATVYPRAVILGDPGFGKSWLLRYEARRLACHALRQLDAGATFDEIQLPILTRLADVARAAKTRTVSEALAALAARSAQDNALSTNFHAWVVERLQSGCCVVLLDAWDEVAEAPSLPGEVLSRAELAVKLSHFSTPRVLMTSRGAGYTSSPITGAQELELIAFEQNQIKQFARVWFDSEPDSSERFLALLEEFPQIRGLARIPLMLSLLSRMFTSKRTKAFPQTRCEIYEQCLRGLLQDWKEEKQPGVEIHDADATLEALSALAFALPIEQGAFKRSFLRQQILQWLGELRSGDSFYGKQPETIILRLLQDGILIKANDERDPDYLFLHRTFHEYLTACALAKCSDWLKKALQKIYDPAWLQVLILLGGRLETAEQAESYIFALRNEQFKNSIFNRFKFLSNRRFKDIFFRPFILAVFTTQETRETLSEKTKKQLFDETLRHWLEPPYWLYRKWFLNALLSWNKHAFPALRAIWHDKQAEDSLRCNVLEVLATLQDREILRDLLALLRDKHTSYELQRAAIDALATLQGCEALPDLRAFLSKKQTSYAPQRDVVKALATLQDCEALPELLALLRDEQTDIVVRMEIVKALAALKDREALSEMFNLVRDEKTNSVLQEGIVTSLATFQDSEILPDKLALLRDERVTSYLKRDLVKALLMFKDRRTLSDMLPLLRDSRVNNHVRFEIAKSLAALKDRGTLSDIIALLRDEQVNDVWGELWGYEEAKDLATLMGREAMPDLGTLLNDSRLKGKVRFGVAIALATLQDYEILAILRTALRDKQAKSWALVEIVKVLTKIKDCESLPDMRALLRDEQVNTKLRIEVVSALTTLQDRDALPDMRVLLRDEQVNTELRIEVASALAMLQDRDALPDMRALLRDEQVNARGRLNVIEALVTLKDREALPDMLTLLCAQGMEASWPFEVTRAMVPLMDRETLPHMRALFRGSRVNDQVRRAIAEALFNLRDREALPDMVALVRNWHPNFLLYGEVRDGLLELAQTLKIPIRF